MVGTIKDYRNVNIEVAGQKLDFIIADVESALGILPTAMGKQVFNLEKLRKGSIITMRADIKADFVDF